ncbi:hypothetical protein IPG41_03790 [Candidatus Peregrinibacteria bacterium]|nr:MAG: hypothetical protein IPG41_03790 [Candidatus Peregrinibacteria bacterium]
MALVNYAFEQNQHGVVNVLLGPQMSEWFNGEALGEDTDYLSPQEQKRHLENLFRKELQLGLEKVNIQFLNEENRHRPLFTQIEALTHTIPITPEALFTGFELRPLDPTSNELSYQIAGRLFQVAQANPALKGEFLRTVPPGASRVSREAVEDVDPDSAGWGSAGYGLCEVAIRMADLIQGRGIQLGVDRQGKYDAIIQKFLKHANQSQQSYPQFKELYDLLKGKVFRPIRLNTKENFFKKKKEQIQARIRSGIHALGVLTLVISTYRLGRHQGEQNEEEAQARVDAQLVECAQSLRFPLCTEDSWCWGQYKTDTGGAFKDMKHRLIEEVQFRYGVSPSFTFEPELVDYLCEVVQDGSAGRSLVEGAEGQRYKFVQLLDGFVTQQRAVFAKAGYPLDRPYPELWEKRDLIFSANEQQTEEPLNPVYVGRFYSDRSYRNIFELWTDASRTGLWAMHPGIGSKPSKELGLEAAQEFADLQSFHDLGAMQRAYVDLPYLAWENARQAVRDGKDITHDCNDPDNVGGYECLSENQLVWKDVLTDRQFIFTIVTELTESFHLSEYVLASGGDGVFTARQTVEAEKFRDAIYRATWK